MCWLLLILLTRLLSLVQNDLSRELPIRIRVRENVDSGTLESDTFNTFLMQA
jgi:hypothetical protein